MKRIIIIALAALIGFTVSAAELTVADASASAQIFKKSKAEIKEVVFHVNLHCNSCVKKVQENISFEKGVKDLHVCLDDQTVSIKYDAAKTTEDKLEAAIEKLGYPVSGKRQGGHAHGQSQESSHDHGHDHSHGHN
jgi:copper chaperone CopZ